MEQTRQDPVTFTELLKCLSSSFQNYVPWVKYHGWLQADCAKSSYMHKWTVMPHIKPLKYFFLFQILVPTLRGVRITVLAEIWCISLFVCWLMFKLNLGSCTCKPGLALKLLHLYNIQGWTGSNQEFLMILPHDKVKQVEQIGGRTGMLPPCALIVVESLRKTWLLCFLFPLFYKSLIFLLSNSTSSMRILLPPEEHVDVIYRFNH